MKTVLVQMADQAWTAEAMNLACAMVRIEGGRVILLQLIYTPHPGWLGTDYQGIGMGIAQWDALKSYKATAEQFGVELIVQPMQYNTLADALVQAAAEVGAVAVFARLPKSRVARWRRLQMFWLEHQLQSQRRQLHTLEQPINARWTPSVTAQAAP